MATFFPLTDAAGQLGVTSEELLRWIQEGRARATRQGGTYILRAHEVARLRATRGGGALEVGPGRSAAGRGELPELEEVPPPGPPAAATQGSTSEALWSEVQERRRSQGRRQTDQLSVESLEAVSRLLRAALEEALSPLLQAQEGLTTQLELHLSGGPAGPPSPLPAAELEPLRVALGELQQGLEGGLEALAGRLDRLAAELPPSAGSREPERARVEAELEPEPEPEPERDPRLAPGHADLRAERDEALARVDGLERSLKELTFRLSLEAGEPGRGALEDSRSMLEAIARLEAEASEKDGLLQQLLQERAQLRAEVEELHRRGYELQQRFDNEKREWSQILDGLNRENQALRGQGREGVDPARPKGWRLFRPRGGMG